MSTETYTVEGMTCSHCERSVREEVEAVGGVRSARADRATGQLVVDGDGLDKETIRAAVEDAGYSLRD